MSSLDALLGYVRPWAPGVPEPIAYRNIRLAAIEFCERTRLWKYEDEFSVTESTCNDGIYTPSGSVLHDIEAVMFDGQKLTPLTTRDADSKLPGWRTGDVGTGRPKYFTQVELGTIRILPAYAGSLYLCTRLKPSQDCDELPDFMLTEFAELIGWGALSRILTIPGQSYTSPDLSTYYGGMFMQRIDRLSTKESRGQQNAPRRTRPRYF